MKPTTTIQAILIFQDFLSNMERHLIDMQNSTHVKVIDLERKLNQQTTSENDLWEAIGDLRGDVGAIHSAQKELTQAIYEDIKMTKKMLGAFENRVSKLDNGKTKNKRKSRS